MALTKVGKEGITGISNSSDATAITIDSSEKVGIGTTSPTYQATVFGSSQSTVEIESGSDTGESRLYFTDPTTTGVGTIEYHHNGNTMRFQTNSTERMRLLSGGGVDISAGNLVLDNGYGIEFTATANSSGTVTHEILDDYEIGTFTPHFQMGLTSPGYSVQQGTYVKIGSLVVCSIYLRANSGTENGDHIYVGGLPFTVITGGSIDHQYGAFFTYNGGFWTSDANTQWLALKNQTNLAFYKQSDGGAIQGTTSGVATNLNADLRLVAVYRS